MLIILLLNLELLPLLLLPQLLLEEGDLRVHVGLELRAYLAFLIAFELLPLLAFAFKLGLVGPEDLLLLKLKVLIDLLDGADVLLLKELSLLFDVFIDLCLDQRVLLLGGEACPAGSRQEVGLLLLLFLESLLLLDALAVDSIEGVLLLDVASAHVDVVDCLALVVGVLDHPPVLWDRGAQLSTR
jgi:hypothetical protein